MLTAEYPTLQCLLATADAEPFRLALIVELPPLRVQSLAVLIVELLEAILEAPGKLAKPSWPSTTSFRTHHITS